MQANFINYFYAFSIFYLTSQFYKNKSEYCFTIIYCCTNFSFMKDNILFFGQKDNNF